MKGNSRRKLDQRTFMTQVRECRDKGYLLSPKKIGSGAFSKVYLAYTTQERMQHNLRLASDCSATACRSHPPLQVAIKIISTAEAPVEFAQKFLPREILSLNATYKHLNVVQLYKTYHNSQRAYLVLELAGRGDLLEHINTVSDHCRCLGLEEKEAHRLFWQLVSAVAHCHSSGVVHRDLKCENILLDDQGFLKLTDFGFAHQSAPESALLSTYAAPEILQSRTRTGERADRWSLWVPRAPRGPGPRAGGRPESPAPRGVVLYAVVTGKLPFKERRGPAFPPVRSPADGPAEPREDSEPTRPLRQQQGTPKSASGPAPPLPEARLSRGAGSRASRRPAPFAMGPLRCAHNALRSAPGHRLVSRGQWVDRVEAT